MELPQLICTGIDLPKRARLSQCGGMEKSTSHCQKPSLMTHWHHCRQNYLEWVPRPVRRQPRTSPKRKHCAKPSGLAKKHHCSAARSQVHWTSKAGDPEEFFFAARLGPRWTARRWWGNPVFLKKIRCWHWNLGFQSQGVLARWYSRVWKCTCSETNPSTSGREVVRAGSAQNRCKSWRSNFRAGPLETNLGHFTADLRVFRRFWGGHVSFKLWRLWLHFLPRDQSGWGLRSIPSQSGNQEIQDPRHSKT